jgi:hypothetical protein
MEASREKKRREAAEIGERRGGAWRAKKGMRASRHTLNAAVQPVREKSV